jgi:hypothetical protein
MRDSEIEGEDRGVFGFGLRHFREWVPGTYEQIIAAVTPNARSFQFTLWSACRLTIHSATLAL